jgi:integrase
MARGKRVRVARCIYRDAYGYSICVRRQEYRRPLGTPESALLAFRDDLEHRPAETRPRQARGTLADDVDRYIGRVKHLASWRERRSDLRAWVALYGPWPRSRLRREHVIAARLRWLEEGRTPKCVNNRVDALRQLCRELDGGGRHVPTPCDHLAPLSVPKQPKQAVSVETILRTYYGLLGFEHLGRLRDSKTRARFMVLASCGVRPSELMRAKPEDVDLDRRVWYTRDGKGGVRPGGLYLHDDLLAAMTLFSEAGAWGKYDTSAFARTLRSAGWPPGVRPYLLRSSVGIALSEGGTDLADISGWLGHSRIDTTRQHYVPILAGRMRQVGESLNGRIGWPGVGSQSTERGETAGQT